MKQLILIRHAAAEPEVYPKLDFDRNLEPSGLAEAEKLGSFIRLQKILPQKILTSSAIRTMQTAERIRKILDLSSEFILPSIQMYNAIISVLKDQIISNGEPENCIALVAHNPGISQLASFLINGNHIQIPTAGAVCLTFQIENWAELKPASGKSLWYFSP